MTKDELVATIKEMNVLELADVVKTLEEEFGISAAAPVAVAAPAGPAAPCAPAVPAEPAGPAGPWGPALPWGPPAPVWPAAPVAPDTPASPVQASPMIINATMKMNPMLSACDFQIVVSKCSPYCAFDGCFIDTPRAPLGAGASGIRRQVFPAHCITADGW